MSKICSNCGRPAENDEFLHCPFCGGEYIEQPAEKKSGFNVELGRANAVNGGIHHNDNSTHTISNTSNVVNNVTNVAATKTERELIQERVFRYQEEVRHFMVNGIVTTVARAKLQSLQLEFNIDANTAQKIEAVVKNEQLAKTTASSDTLPVIAKMALKSAIGMIGENSPQVANSIRKLAPICKTTTNEEVHYYYNMLLAAFEPEECVKLYETRTSDAYWKTFWASIAYRKTGNSTDAEVAINDLVKWQEYPEINMLVNACAGMVIENSEENKELVIEYLSQSETPPSGLLSGFFHTILNVVGIEDEECIGLSFYKEHLLTSKSAPTHVEEKKEAPGVIEKAMPSETKSENDAESLFIMGEKYSKGEGGQEDKRQAFQYYKQAAEKGHKAALFTISDMIAPGNPNSIEAHVLEYSERPKWIRLAAEQGYASAQTNLGFLYQNGNWGLPQDYQEAIKWFVLAAKQGSALAMTFLGELFLELKDIKQAIKWTNQAVERLQGTENAYQYGETCGQLGDIFYYGNGVPQDYQEAAKWYKLAEEAEDNIGLYTDNLCVCYNAIGDSYFNNSPQQDYREAKKWYTNAAELGNAYAQAQVGWLYKEGLGVNHNYQEAAKWYKLAAEQGNAFAQAELGGYHQGVNQDFQEAVKWYRLSANQGNSFAQVQLGDAFFHGRGVNQNYQEAAKWYKLAAEQGNVDAQATLGDLYNFGDGVPQNYQEAAKWYKLASDQGVPYAQFRLGLLYNGGQGVTKDPDKAGGLFKAAAEAGVAPAQFLYGLYLKEMRKDYNGAIKWFQLAAEQGDENAIHELNKNNR